MMPVRSAGRCLLLPLKHVNHPALAHGRLFVRDAEEIACYALSPKDP